MRVDITDELARIRGIIDNVKLVNTLASDTTVYLDLGCLLVEELTKLRAELWTVDADEVEDFDRMTLQNAWQWIDLTRGVDEPS